MRTRQLSLSEVVDKVLDDEALGKSQQRQVELLVRSIRLGLNTDSLWQSLREETESAIKDYLEMEIKIEADGGPEAA